ncbi:unnamed protein product [Pieris macdunnoughi]|uniref:Uncharacterized protein n=1 Tax=Pieris macdunnoughi TaxID=345717 RepID=A0A821PVM8_9NEOP|nr:unnamed protein product [Pieris macdunnoughi]
MKAVFVTKIDTSIRPVVVWPEISSPAQSLASVIKVPSNSCFPWRAAFCSFSFGSLGDSSGSRRQHTKAHNRHSSTTSRPAMNVTIEDRRKHHHFRTLRQSSSSGIGAVVASSSDEAIPRGREASRQARHARAEARALARQPAHDRTSSEAEGECSPRCRSMPRDRSAPARPLPSAHADPRPATRAYLLSRNRHAATPTHPVFDKHLECHCSNLRHVRSISLYSANAAILLCFRFSF